MLHLGSMLHSTNYFSLAVFEVLHHFLVHHLEAPAIGLPNCKSTFSGRM